MVCYGFLGAFVVVQPRVEDELHAVRACVADVLLDAADEQTAPAAHAALLDAVVHLCECLGDGVHVYHG